MKGAGFFSAICASDNVPPADSDSSAPVRHHADVCCILHSGAAVEAEVQRAPPEILRKESPPVLAAPAIVIDAVSADPELRPLSPRAPPAPSV